MSGKAVSSAASAAAAATKEITLLSRPQLLSLYKQILRSAATFPSSKRRGIIRSIKLDWRDGAKLTDRQKLHAEHTRAVDGLRSLRQYQPLSTSNTGAWNLEL